METPPSPCAARRHSGLGEVFQIRSAARTALHEDSSTIPCTTQRLGRNRCSAAFGAKDRATNLIHGRNVPPLLTREVEARRRFKRESRRISFADLVSLD